MHTDRLFACQTGKARGTAEDLLSFVNPSRQEAACVDYHLHVSNDDPNLFIFYENWRSREELDQHLQTPMLTSFWARRLDLLEKDVEIKFITMLSEPS